MENFKEIFESRFTWIEGFMRNVRRFGNKTAMIESSTGQQWTYKELNAETNKLCNALLNENFTKGDVVMLQLFNCAEFAFAYIAAHKLHGVCCPVSFRLSPGELAYNIDDSKPKVLMVSTTKLEDALKAVKLAKHKPERIVVVGSTISVEHLLCENVMRYNDYVLKYESAEPIYMGEYNIYDETTRLYTSGTTGKPKSVPMNSVNEVLSAHDTMILFPLSSKDVTMNTTPWFHRGGVHCGGPCPTFYAGATLVIMGKFNPLSTLKLIGKYKITFIIGVPTVLEELADEQERQDYDIHSLTGIVTMGSPLERAACIRYQKVLTPNIFNGYGTTESYLNTFLRPCDLPEYAGSAGFSCTDDDVRVVKIYDNRRAEPGELVAQNDIEVGEVIISSPGKSPYSFKNNPAETERKYYRGFLYTNDLATWDENHFITIVGRKDDMIISSGENLYPAEIESVLNQHPQVKDCMVTSVPDKMRGQIVTAYIVEKACEDMEPLTPEMLDEFCRESPDIANFKRPRYYRIVGQLPFNATGKKLHAKMKEIALRDLKNGFLYRV